MSSTSITSCMFAIESVGFNGAMLYAAWRFHSNSSRGQAHARRLFLVSLAYLPFFMGCLLLHQRRSPLAVDEDTEAHAALLAEPRERLRARGRELCIHEQIVEMTEELAVSDAEAAARSAHADGRSASGSPPERPAAPAVSAERCPVKLGSAVVSGAHAAVPMPTPAQPAPH